jgi:predicted RNA binding protein YcfA (HicA-like mRNA interferase family)
VGRLAQLKGERLVRALIRLGWTAAQQSGSHVVLTFPGRNPVSVPIHRGKTLKEGTARGILKSAGVTEEQLFEVY